jgi:hypothetical protein
MMRRRDGPLPLAVRPIDRRDAKRLRTPTDLLNRSEETDQALYG